MAPARRWASRTRSHELLALQCAGVGTAWAARLVARALHKATDVLGRQRLWHGLALGEHQPGRSLRRTVGGARWRHWKWRRGFTSAEWERPRGWERPAGRYDDGNGDGGNGRIRLVGARIPGGMAAA